MKTSILTILVLFTLSGCQLFSGDSKEKVDPNKKTSAYNPPAPGQLSKEEVDHYNRLCSVFFEDKLIRRGFNGSILIAKDGNVVYEKYIGKVDLRRPDAITDTTPIHIASVGKTFTAVAILQLIQQGKLSLNDSLEKFFPGIPYPGITVKMLLNHRSGLPNYVYFIPTSKWDKKVYASNQDIVDFLYNEKPNKNFTAGKRFSYSNTNYVLLAMILEKISGMNYPDYMRQHIFSPLQMNHTYVFTLKDSLTATPSFNYNNSVWEYDCLEATYGDKNIYSTPRDMLKWDQALYTEQVINAALRDSAFTPYSQERPSVHNYGLGFRMLVYPTGKKIIYHFGRWHGFNSAFARLTQEKATIIIMGNKFTRGVYTAAKSSYDLFGTYDGQNGQDEEDPEEMNNKKTFGNAPSPVKATAIQAKK